MTDNCDDEEKVQAAVPVPAATGPKEAKRETASKGLSWMLVLLPIGVLVAYGVAYIVEVTVCKGVPPVVAPALFNAGQLGTLIVLVWQFAAQMKASEEQKAAAREQLENAKRQLETAEEAFMYSNSPVLSVEPSEIYLFGSGRPFLEVKAVCVSDAPATQVMVIVRLSGKGGSDAPVATGGLFLDYVRNAEKADGVTFDLEEAELRQIVVTGSVLNFSVRYRSISGGRYALRSEFRALVYDDWTLRWQLVDSRIGKADQFEDEPGGLSVASNTRTVAGGEIPYAWRKTK